MLAGCLLAGLADRARAARSQAARRSRSGSATASSTACCSRCSRSASRSRARDCARGRACSRRCSGSRCRSWSRWCVIRLSVRVLRRDLPEHAVGARRRAQHLVAGLDRGRAVGHRRAAAAARRDGRRALEGRRDADHRCATSSRARSPPAWCWCSRCGCRRRSRRSCCSEPRRRPVDAQDGRQHRARAAAVRRPAARAVGGRHRPDRAVGARRRDRRRPRLRPAEDRRQLRQRLRDPGRAQRCASATWSRSTTSKAASPTSAPATR